MKKTSVICIIILILNSLLVIDNKFLYLLPFDLLSFENIATRGAWHKIDNGEKSKYDKIKDYTEPIYRQLNTEPNLLYIKLPNKNTFFTEDMGMSAYEIDNYGNIIWQRRIQGETYYGIKSINSDEILLSILNKRRLVKIDKRTGLEKTIIEGDYRDIYLTDNKDVVLVENNENGHIIMVNLDGNTIWRSEDTFYWARGVWQKEDKNFLVVDFKNKAYEVDYKTKKIIWTLENILYYPNSIQEMKNGNYLIADEHNNRVIEVNPLTRKVIREYSDGLFSPNYAKEEDNGNWIICDTDNHRIVEINSNNKLLWELSNIYAPNRVDRF